jgi:hypothetical protein
LHPGIRFTANIEDAALPEKQAAEKARSTAGRIAQNL